MIRTLVSIGASLIAATQVAAPAMAQEWPAKQPLKIIVPVPPGGGQDGIARITAEFLNVGWGKKSSSRTSPARLAPSEAISSSERRRTAIPFY